MNKKVLIILAVAIIVIGGGVALWRSSSNKKTDKNDSSSSVAEKNGNYKAIKACDVFALADATAVMGTGTENGVTNSENKSDDLSVSTCSYVHNAGSVKDIRTTTILVRAPLTKEGANSNAAQFGPHKPEKAQDVSGYGSAAFWDPTMGQFNVLKNDVWVIITSGLPSPSQRTLDDAKKIADIVVPKL